MIFGRKKKKPMGFKNEFKQLFAAIDKGDNEKLLALIVYNPALLYCTNERGLTPLMDAVISKNYDAMRLLLQHGANVNRVDSDGWSAKSWAVFIQDKEAMKILSKASVLSRSDSMSGALWGTVGL